MTAQQPLAKTLLFFSLLCFIVFGCKKSDEAICQQLTSGVVADDETKVGNAVEDMIASLPSQEYTQENFDRLSDKLSQQCDIQVVGKCFDCIETLPSQSEIQFSVNSSGITITRTIDLTYTPTNRMKFLNLHE